MDRETNRFVCISATGQMVNVVEVRNIVVSTPHNAPRKILKGPLRYFLEDGSPVKNTSGNEFLVEASGQVLFRA